LQSTALSPACNCSNLPYNHQQLAESVQEISIHSSRRHECCVRTSANLSVLIHIPHETEQVGDAAAVVVLPVFAILSVICHNSTVNYVDPTTLSTLASTQHLCDNRRRKYRVSVVFITDGAQEIESFAIGPEVWMPIQKPLHCWSQLFLSIYHLTDHVQCFWHVCYHAQIKAASANVD